VRIAAIVSGARALSTTPGLQPYLSSSRPTASRVFRSQLRPLPLYAPGKSRTIFSVAMLPGLPFCGRCSCTPRSLSSEVRISNPLCYHSSMRSEEYRNSENRTAVIALTPGRSPPYPLPGHTRLGRVQRTGCRSGGSGRSGLRAKASTALLSWSGLALVKLRVAFYSFIHLCCVLVEMNKRVAGRVERCLVIGGVLCKFS